MKILFLTQYFPPEVGAPQNRIAGLAVNLKKLGAKVDILTGMPNYPTGKVFKQYSRKIFLKEKDKNMTIYRVWLFASSAKNIFSRLLNYFSFTFTSFFVGLFLKRYDLIIVESPPLFLGITGVLLSRLKQSKFVFNVSDLWPESVVKLGYITNKFIITIFTRMEEWIYKKADLVTVQTQGIYEDIKRRIKDKNKLYLLYNGIDKEFWQKVEKSNKFLNIKNKLKNNFVCGYIGNHGYAQGLDVILKVAQTLEKYKIKFLFVGDGPEKKKLIELARKLNLSNVMFLNPVPKKEIPEILNIIDIAIVPLKKLPLFKGAIPSKMFEFMASKKPILLGVQGEAADILKKSNAGLTFIPEDIKDCSDNILKFYKKRLPLKRYGLNGKKFVFKYFNREKISKEYFDALKKILKN